MSRLIRGLKSLARELVKPDSYAKGQDFEEYVRKWIFQKDKYEVVHRTHDYSDNKEDYIEDSLNPDFCFRDKSNKKEFYVEAKFRSSYWKDAIEWTYSDQFKRYNDADQKRPVIIIIGVGGSPKMPEDIFIFPVKAVKYTKLFRSTLRPFDHQPDSALYPRDLWNMLK